MRNSLSEENFLIKAPKELRVKHTKSMGKPNTLLNLSYKKDGFESLTKCDVPGEHALRAVCVKLLGKTGHFDELESWWWLQKFVEGRKIKARCKK